MTLIDSRIVSQYLNVNASNVSDALDRLGLEGQPANILPIHPGCPRIVGPAATLKLVPAGQGRESTVSGTLRAIMRGGAGSVLVVENTLVVLLESGELVLAEANAESWKPLCRAQILGTGVRAVPAVDGGLLVARERSRLVAVRISP